jgi:hypothetical protein
MQRWSHIQCLEATTHRPKARVCLLLVLMSMVACNFVYNYPCHMFICCNRPARQHFTQRRENVTEIIIYVMQPSTQALHVWWKYSSYLAVLTAPQMSCVPHAVSLSEAGFPHLGHQNPTKVFAAAWNHIKNYVSSYKHCIGAP